MRVERGSNREDVTQEMNKTITFSLIIMLIVPVAAYSVFCTYLWAAQDRHIFWPSREIVQKPSDYGLEYEDVFIRVPSENHAYEALHAWWIPAEEIPNQRILLYLHGSAINISANVEHARRFHRMGFSVMLVSYRGYGLSDGDAPSEQTMYDDAEAAWAHLLNEKKVRPGQIMVYGHSLGGAVAIELAARHPEAAGLIVESTFTSIREVAEKNPFYRLFPLDWLIEHSFDSISKVGSLTVPILFLHGTQDSFIPYKMSRLLYERASGERRLALIFGGGHSNNARIDPDRYLREVSSFVSTYLDSGGSHIRKDPIDRI